MAGRMVYWNGGFIPESQARLSIYDSALMFGDMVFEMTRSFNKDQFMLKEHLRRLYSSARWLRIPIPLTMEKMEEACKQTVQANDRFFEEDDEHRLMINITRGILSIYEGADEAYPGTNVIIADFPLRWTVRGMGELFDKGINAVIPSQRSIPAQLLEPKAKTRSRMHLMVANIQASRFKGENNWPLLLDPDGFISEGTGDNFFIVKDGMLITPEPRNILRGISRDFVLKMADHLGIDWREKNIEPYNVMEADEAFMTGTPFCMLPVVSLDGMKIGMGKPGTIYHQLLRWWGECVGLDIKQQIQEWDKNDTETVKGSTPYRFEE